LGSDVSLNHVVSHLIQQAIASMQYSAETTSIFRGDASLDHVFSHPFQPTVKEVVMLMQYSVDPTLLVKSDKPKEVTLLMQSSVNPTLLLGGDAYFNHVLSISSHVPFEQGSIPLSSSALPPSPRVVSFYWNGLIEPRHLPSTPFQIKGILRYIVDKVTSASILSSLERFGFSHACVSYL
jgi:hypothetical protein